MTEETAQIKLYTLSDIENWKVYNRTIPRDTWKKYTSKAYGFEDWIQINNESFNGAADMMLKKGRRVSIDTWDPFSLQGSVSIAPRDSHFYLFKGSLVGLHPRREEDYVITPESPHFRERHLIESVNLTIFSETRKRLEEVAKELNLPSVVAKK